MEAGLRKLVSPKVGKHFLTFRFALPGWVLLHAGLRACLVMHRSPLLTWGKGDKKGRSSLSPDPLFTGQFVVSAMQD